MRNKFMGQAKYQINKQLDTDLNDIKINRVTCEVHVNDKKVAWFADDDALRLKYDSSVEVIADKVEKTMKPKMQSKPQ